MPSKRTNLESYVQDLTQVPGQHPTAEPEYFTIWLTGTNRELLQKIYTALDLAAHQALNAACRYAFLYAERRGKSVQQLRGYTKKKGKIRVRFTPSPLVAKLLTDAGEGADENVASACINLGIQLLHRGLFGRLK